MTTRLALIGARDFVRGGGRPTLREWYALDDADRSALIHAMEEYDEYRAGLVLLAFVESVAEAKGEAHLGEVAERILELVA